MSKIPVGAYLLNSGLGGNRGRVGRLVIVGESGMVVGGNLESTTEINKALEEIAEIVVQAGFKRKSLPGKKNIITQSFQNKGSGENDLMNEYAQ